MKKLTTLLLCMLFVLLSAMPAMALELDDTENSEAAPFSEAALAEETSLSIPVLDKVNGKLLLFKDFEQENATTASYAYMDTNYMTGTSVSYASASGAVAANPNGTGSVLQITPTDGWV